MLRRDGGAALRDGVGRVESDVLGDGAGGRGGRVRGDSEGLGVSEMSGGLAALVISVIALAMLGLAAVTAIEWWRHYK